MESIKDRIVKYYFEDMETDDYENFVIKMLVERDKLKKILGDKAIIIDNYVYYFRGSLMDRKLIYKED